MAKNSHPFPTKSPFSKEQVEQRFWRCDHTLCPDKSYHFSLMIPKTWRPVDVPADPPTEERPIVPIALFRHTERPRAEIEITAVRIGREVAPGDWLDLYLSNGREEILNRRDVRTVGGILSDILSRVRTRQGMYVSRWLTIKDGKRLFVFQGRVAEVDYPKFADTFFMAISGFKLLHPGDWPLAESLKTFSVAQPSDFLIAYPESWELVEDPSTSVNALVLQLTHQMEGVVAGKITVAVIKRSAEASAQGIADNYVSELVRGGIGVRQLRLEPVQPGKNFEAAWEAEAEGVLGSRAVEVRMLVAQRPDAWFFAGLLGPSRKALPDVWAINKRALAIVVDFLKTPGEDKGDSGSPSTTGENSGDSESPPVTAKDKGDDGSAPGSGATDPERKD